MQAAELVLDNKPALAPSPAWLRWLGKVVDWSVISIGAALATLIFINVVMHAMAKDLAWLTELGELMMVWVTFLGGAAAAHRGAHMSINEFLDKLTLERRRWADAAVQCFTLVVLAVVLFYGVRIVQGQLGQRADHAGVADGLAVHAHAAGHGTDDGVRRLGSGPDPARFSA